MNTSISRCLKTDFQAFTKVSDNEYILRWGMEPVVEKVTVINEETGEPEETGEVKDTDWCTYQSGTYEGILTPYLLEKAIPAGRAMSCAEMDAIYSGIGMTEEERLPLLKNHLGELITLYDKSSAVEDFTIGGVHLWLDSTLRGKVRENLETCGQFGETNTTLRIDGMAFPVTVEQGWQMYYAVLAYARACWNVTEGHRASADALESVDAVKSYDYTVGYPEKVAF